MDKHSWNPTNDPMVAQALAVVWGHCSEIERGETPDEWRVSMSAAEVLGLLAAESERIARHFDARDRGKDGKPLGIGFYEPHEPAEIIRALATNVEANRPKTARGEP